MESWRAAVVDEALSWLNTPYHAHARVKGAGVDCIMLPAEVYERAGLIGHVEPGHYSIQAGLHDDAELLLSIVAAYGCRVVAAQPADLVLFHYGRSYSHAGIMVSDTRFVHAAGRVGLVCLTDLADAEVADRKPRFFEIGPRP